MSVVVDFDTEKKNQKAAMVPFIIQIAILVPLVTAGEFFPLLELAADAPTVPLKYAPVTVSIGVHGHNSAATTHHKLIKSGARLPSSATIKLKPTHADQTVIELSVFAGIASSGDAHAIRRLIIPCESEKFKARVKVTLSVDGIVELELLDGAVATGVSGALASVELWQLAQDKATLAACDASAAAAPGDAAALTAATTKTTELERSLAAAESAAAKAATAASAAAEAERAAAAAAAKKAAAAVTALTKRLTDAKAALADAKTSCSSSSAATASAASENAAALTAATTKTAKLERALAAAESAATKATAAENALTKRLADAKTALANAKTTCAMNAKSASSATSSAESERAAALAAASKRSIEAERALADATSAAARAAKKASSAASASKRKLTAAKSALADAKRTCASGAKATASADDAELDVLMLASALLAGLLVGLLTGFACCRGKTVEKVVYKPAPTAPAAAKKPKKKKHKSKYPRPNMTEAEKIEHDRQHRHVQEVIANVEKQGTSEGLMEGGAVHDDSNALFVSPKHHHPAPADAVPTLGEGAEHGGESLCEGTLVHKTHALGRVKSGQVQLRRDGFYTASNRHPGAFVEYAHKHGSTPTFTRATIEHKGETLSGFEIEGGHFFFPSATTSTQQNAWFTAMASAGYVEKK